MACGWIVVVVLVLVALYVVVYNRLVRCALVQDC